MTCPDHPFHGLALMDKYELLEELKREHLTLKPTEQVPLATGVPSHIDCTIVLKNLFDLCKQIDIKVYNYSETLRRRVFDAIDQKAKVEDGVNSIILLKVLNKLKEHLFCRINVFGESGLTLPPCNVPTLPVVKNNDEPSYIIALGEYKGGGQ